MIRKTVNWGDPPKKLKKALTPTDSNEKNARPPPRQVKKMPDPPTDR